MKEAFITFYSLISPYFLWYFSAINVVYTILLILGIIKVYRRRKEITIEEYTNILKSDSLPQITFVAPVYNNAKDTCRLIKNLTDLSYRYKKVILVNDGSTDDTLEILKEKLEVKEIPQLFKIRLKTKPIKMIYQSKRFDNVILIDKENGKRSDALNAGINAVQDDFFIAIDPDTVIDNDEFEKLIRPILTYPETIAVGASIRIKNGCVIRHGAINTDNFPDSFLGAMQTLEYLRAFLERQGWDYFGGNVCVSGAFSVIKTKIFITAGGYIDSIAQDMEIIMRLHRIMKKINKPYRIMYLPDPAAWTDGPDTLKMLKYQRANWHRGMLDSIYLHKGVFLNPRYGFFGLFTFPFWVWGEAIEPLVEFLGYFVVIFGLLFGLTDAKFVALFLLVTWGYTFLFTIFCILIEDFSFRKYKSLKTVFILMFCDLAEYFGYRQLTIL
jgi:cellulose synthase/poly-beta-1,6-N-acetylglucosamine synthase-like glycosyltransferase